MSEQIIIGGQMVKPGTQHVIELPRPGLYINAPVSLQAHVFRGRLDGPKLFISAAVHGDELNGIEIIRRILSRPALRRLRGLLIALPIVNVYGVLNQSRYLPDRRDLNRSFPGNERGSLAARMADMFMKEVVGNCTHGIDFHTGAVHRTNLPQIRADISDRETEQMAQAFGVPVILNSSLRDGSLREAARGQGVRMLLYEAGEALRFDEISIRSGERGALNVMRALGMLPKRASTKRRAEPFVARSSSWVRAPDSGFFIREVREGTLIKSGMVLGEIVVPSADKKTPVVATFNGVVIGHAQLPLVHEGDALFHIARFEDSAEVAGEVEAFRQEHEPNKDAQDSPNP
jgi:predicted deacylase